MTEPRTETSSVVYFILGRDSIKIGVSTSVQKRLAQLRTSSSDDLKLLATIPGDIETEIHLHRRLWSHRRRGEWFADNPEVRACVNNACGFDVFKDVPASAAEPPQEPEISAREWILKRLNTHQSRLTAFVSYTLRGSTEDWQAPEFKALPIAKRYLMLAAVQMAVRHFHQQAGLVDEGNLDNEGEIRAYGCACASVEQLECHIEMILGAEDAAYLSGWEMAERFDPNFMTDQGRLLWRSTEDARKNGWEPKVPTIGDYLSTKADVR